jgi:AAA domain, putative AbiEii toxin, Type IV TA system
MLKRLSLSNVGPAPQLTAEFGERLNLLTGDNGLGKSFLLDIAWWSLTRRWPAELNPAVAAGYTARPRSLAKAEIKFEFTTKTGKTESYTSTFDRSLQAWTGRPGRPSNPGLVLYAQVDGSFAVWDPARNYWKQQANAEVSDRPLAYVFGPKQVWDGLLNDKGIPLCNGLIRDWASWQREGGETMRWLQTIVQSLSPVGEHFTIGDLTRISLDDARDIPTLKMPYGESVPILFASAGVRRVMALAYLLVWTWREHTEACKLRGEQPARQVVFLVDEIEAHLHPRWQRSVVGSLLGVVSGLAPQASVQLIAATHSPLVMASAEPTFDAKQDAWLDLDLVRSEDGQTQVELTSRTFVRHGDASSWMMSEAFDMKSARSVEAEGALEAASTAMTNPAFSKADAKKLNARLLSLLSDTDPFWLRWRYVADKKGWLV